VGVAPGRDVGVAVGVAPGMNVGVAVGVALGRGVGVGVLFGAGISTVTTGAVGFCGRLPLLVPPPSTAGIPATFLIV